MALTTFQRGVCRLLADHRIASGESYVADASRVSMDIDLFHDTEEALEASWDADRHLLEAHGFEVRVIRERCAFVEAEVAKDRETVLVQWARDSAYRFFPLVGHPDFGLTLHPFDLATNKVLALVGRLEVRDWVDLIHACKHLQPLGYLAWAACGKDPGFSPAGILDQAARSNYSATEVRTLAFATEPPDAGDLSRRWRAMLATGREIVEGLPHTEVGRCVLSREGTLFAGDARGLRLALERGNLRFHAGRIRGAMPELKGS
jgi:hypothetical protein